MDAADVETVETGIGNPILLKSRLSLEELTNVTRYPTLVRYCADPVVFFSNCMISRHFGPGTSCLIFYSSTADLGCTGDRYWVPPVKPERPI